MTVDQCKICRHTYKGRVLTMQPAFALQGDAYDVPVDDDCSAAFSIRKKKRRRRRMKKKTKKTKKPDLSA